MKPSLPLLAIVALLAAFAAQGATAAPLLASHSTSTALRLPSVAEEEDEGEEEEFGEEAEFEECGAEDIGFEFDEEEGEEELTPAEEGELEEECGEDSQGKDKKGSPFVSAPAACHVSRAESTITTLPASDQVRLTVHYRTWAPTAVTVGLKLRDGKGSVAIEHAKEHLGKSGVLQLTTKLGGSIMDRALGASEFDVSLLAPGSPSYCASALEQRLRSVKHTGADAPRVYSARS